MILQVGEDISALDSMKSQPVVTVIPATNVFSTPLFYVVEKDCTIKYMYIHSKYNIYMHSPKVSGTYMEVLNLYKAILGVGFPLHKPYPYSLYR